MANTTGTSYTDTNVTAGTVYYYEISAVTSGGPTTNSLATIGLPVAYWNNITINPPQNWNVNGNWTNSGAFPNSVTAGAG